VIGLAGIAARQPGCRARVHHAPEKREPHAATREDRARFFVTGPDADSLIPLNNGWSYTWQGNRESAYPKDHATILKAIQEKIGAAT